MRNLAFFLSGFLVITLVAIAPEVFAADSNGNADNNDIYLLIVGVACAFSFYKGFGQGQQR